MKPRMLASHLFKPVLKGHTTVKNNLRQAEAGLDRLRHATWLRLPGLIRPDPRGLYVSLTSLCNYRCQGCHYGRDFMPGQTLPLPVVKDLLTDAKALGFERVRLYGGEPLLHPQLPEIVAHAVELGLKVWVTTNGLLLRKKIDALVEAGLRTISFGFYGLGPAYDRYVERPGAFATLEQGIGYARERYGDQLFMYLDWLLMRPTCTVETVQGVRAFAQRYNLSIFVNLVHYSLPYFTGPEKPELQLYEADRPQVEAVVGELLRWQAEYPDKFLESRVGLRSIPDWLIHGPAMHVPCTGYRLTWIGADGTVQLCYVTFKLGNLHEQRLKDLLFTPQHHQAARDAFLLNCPNCHCGYDIRVARDEPSYQYYRAIDAR